jgi:hypothetical protein
MSIPESKLYNDKIREIGEIAEYLPDQYISSFVAAETIPFGFGVARGAKGERAKVISSATDEFLGAAAKSFEASDFDNAMYSEDDPTGIVRKGIIVVAVDEAVKPGDKVRVRHGAATGKTIGIFCKTAEAGKTAVIEHAEWKSATEGGRAVLWLSGPFKLIAD